MNDLQLKIPLQLSGGIGTFRNVGCFEYNNLIYNGEQRERSENLRSQDKGCVG